MIAKYEKRQYEGKERVWVGRYRNLSNLPHWHLECELIYVEQGQIEVSENHATYQLESQQAIFLKSGEVHYIVSNPASVVWVLLFDPKLIRKLTEQVELIDARLSHTDQIEPALRRMRMELSDKPLFYEMQLESYVTTFMLQIFRREHLQPAGKQLESSAIANYKKLLDEIDQNYNTITFQQAANMMGFTEPYFSRFFRKLSGMTFSNYLNIVRIDHALLLLEEDDKITTTDLAFACGFETIRHFNRVFKTITGVTPGQVNRDLIPDITPVRKSSDSVDFNPTLQMSELL